MAKPRPFDAWSLREAAQALLLVSAALEAGLLQLLVHRRSVVDLAAERDLDPRAVSICLGALEELGIVDGRPEGYRLTKFGRSRFVDPESGAFVADGLPLWRANLRGWLFLDEILRSGRPVPEGEAAEDLRDLYQALDAKPSSRVDAVVAQLMERAARPRVLDVGGGSGVYARAFAARGASVTLLDRPAVIEYVRDAFALDALEGLTPVAGDFNVSLPEGPFDVVLLADVLHTLNRGEASALVARAATVCAPGGVIGVVEPLRGRSDGAAFLAVTMLLYTDGGDVYREEDVVAWLEEGGLRSIEVRDLDARHALVTGARSS